MDNYCHIQSCNIFIKIVIYIYVSDLYDLLIKIIIFFER
jgi:hypothetical protein